VWSGGEWRVITQERAGVPGEPRRDDQFGSSMTSGDFNGDGWADLAIGTPGKELVAVLHGSPTGFLGGGTRQLRRPPRFGSEGDLYGSTVLAHDFNGDGYDDLVVGAPGGTTEDPARGVAHLLFGTPDGLRVRGAVTLRPPDADMRLFGTRFRAGDVDADGHPDLIMGIRETVDGPGYGVYCAGSPRGPRECRRFGSGGTSSFGVADVNGDDRDDIVQGDIGPRDPLTGARATAGEVRIWLGGPEGPRSSPLLVTQETENVPGDDELGDEFGAVVEAGDVDDDGFADLVVTSTGEDEGEGRITVIRGGRDGIADTGHSHFDQSWPEVPGEARAGNRFGSSLTLLRLSDDDQLDLAVGARGVRAAERIMVVEGGPGVFAPGETRTRELPDVTRLVAARRGGPIRFARRSGG
jgi:FG-GAP repeat